MDIKIDGLSSTLDENKINNGVWIHCESADTDPETGKTSPLYLGGDTSKPLRALVRSYRCKLLKDLEAQRQKDGLVKIRVAKKKERDEVIADNAIIPEKLRFGYFLVALENFSKSGGVQHLTPEQGAALFDNTAVSHIVDQVKEAAYDDDLYLAGSETEAGNAARSTGNLQAE